MEEPASSSRALRRHLRRQRAYALGAVTCALALHPACAQPTVDVSYSHPIYAGTNWTAQTVRVCAVVYPPFVIPAATALNSSVTATVPPGTYNASSCPLLGYDIEYAGLLFSNALGVTDLRFVLVPHYLALYLGLRSGVCDVGLSAAELDLTRSTCSSSCAPVPPSGSFDALFASADYADGYTSGTGPQLQAADCCLDYSAAYFSSSGFGLATRALGSTSTVFTALISAQVINIGLVLVMLVLVSGWLMVSAEHQVNSDLDNVAAGIFLAVTTTSTVGFGDIVAKTNLGRVILGALMIATLITGTMFTSSLSAALTTGQLTATVIDSPTQLDANQPVCVENDYRLAVQTAKDFGLITISMAPQDCLRAVASGAVQAFLDDIPVIAYWTNSLAMSDIYISPSIAPNSFAAVYPTGSPLRQWANTGILAMRTDETLKALSGNLWRKYFSVNNVQGKPLQQSLDWRLLGACIAMIVLTLVLWAGADLKAVQRLTHWLSVPPRWSGDLSTRALKRSKTLQDAAVRRSRVPAWEELDGEGKGEDKGVAASSA